MDLNVVKNNSYDVLGRGCIAIFEKYIKKIKDLDEINND